MKWTRLISLPGGARQSVQDLMALVLSAARPGLWKRARSFRAAALSSSNSSTTKHQNVMMKPRILLRTYPGDFRALQADPRSEEHTSELQSLMRISYAVFCLKK